MKSTEYNHTCNDERGDGDEECLACGVRDCPYDEPLHYHHDGCPACIFEDEQKDEDEEEEEKADAEVLDES